MFVTTKTIVLSMFTGVFFIWVIWISVSIERIELDSPSMKRSHNSNRIEKGHVTSGVLNMVCSLDYGTAYDEDPRAMEKYDSSPWILKLNESKHVPIDPNRLSLKYSGYSRKDTNTPQIPLKRWCRRLYSWLKNLSPLEHLFKRRHYLIKRMRKIQDYYMMDILGSGGFGSVRLAMLKADSGRKYAIKRVPKHKIMPHRWMKLSKIHSDSSTESQSTALLPVEASILLYIRSLPPSFGQKLIVKLEEYLEDREYYYLVFDWLPHAIDLTHLFGNSANKRNYPSFFVTKRILFLIAQSVAFLHDHHIVHGDIKDENVLLYGERNSIQSYRTHVKLIDFGSCDYLPRDSSSMLMEYRGGSKYKSPEVESGNFPFDGFKQDIWALGILYYFILYRKFPFLNPGDSVSNHLIFPRHSFLTPELRQLITSMLDKNPQTRPSAHEIINHPFFKRRAYIYK